MYILWSNLIKNLMLCVTGTWYRIFLLTCKLVLTLNQDFKTFLQIHEGSECADHTIVSGVAAASHTLWIFLSDIFVRGLWGMSATYEKRTQRSNHKGKLQENEKHLFKKWITSTWKSAHYDGIIQQTGQGHRSLVCLSFDLVPFPGEELFLKANLFVVTGFVVLFCFVGQHVLPPLIGGSVYHARRDAAASHYRRRKADASWSSLLRTGSGAPYNVPKW